MPPKFWYHRGIVSYLLLPLSCLYWLVISLRRLYYKYASIHHFSVPVIVVGNITVGGTGKTPLVIYLAEFLDNHGYKPGIISRGYGGQKNGSVIVTPKSKAEEVGDEALLIACRVNCPVVVDVDRVAAAKKLLAMYDCNIIISDDGLQHYALSRDIEIVVVDAGVKFGNEFCLPAGPLREPLCRLREVDFIVKNFNTDSSSEVAHGEYKMVLEATVFRNVYNRSYTKSGNYFKGKVVHAVAGIGNPQRFFTTLRQLGLKIIEHPFPDHYHMRPVDFSFGDEIVVMTEKDAVKCELEASENCWYLEISAMPSEEFVCALLKKLKEGKS